MARAGPPGGGCPRSCRWGGRFNPTRLLSDLRILFGEHGGAAIASRDICEALAQVEDGPWPTFNKGKPITPAQLANLLKPFGVSPLSVRPHSAPHTTAKGYKLSELKDPFARYLPN